MRVCDRCLVAVYRPAWSNAAHHAVVQGRPVVHEPTPIIERKGGVRRTEEVASSADSILLGPIFRMDGSNGIVGWLRAASVLVIQRRTHQYGMTRHSAVKTVKLRDYH